MKLLIFMLLVTTLSYSQSISKQVVGTAGKTLSGSNVLLTWTAGEPVVGLMTAGGNQLGNGYYPAMDIQALSLEDHLIVVEIKVFPNPTSHSIYITHPELTNFQIKISDMNGKELFEGKVEKEVPINISNYTSGMYLITIDNNETNKKNTYKVIKK